jgi:hypothetical protein
MPDVFINITTPRPLDNSVDGEFVLRQLCQYSSLTPEKFNNCEPIKQIFDCVRVKEIAEKDWMSFVFLWKKMNPRSQGTVFTRMGRGRKTGDMLLSVDSAHLNLGETLSFFQTTAGHFAATFGFLHLLTEPDIISGNVSKGVSSRGRGQYSVSVTRFQLVKYLPELYWATIFGPLYVEMFGRECLLSAPAAIVRELAPNVIYLQLTDNLLDVKRDFGSFAAERMRVKEHLGVDAFFDPSLGTSHKYRVPDFGWDEADA